MSLSNDLISQFAKLTAGEKKQSAEATVYGTTVEYEDRIFVKIDGSDLLTPVETTSDIKSGQRVMIKLKDHTATVTGNVTDPSVGQGKVDDAKEEVKEEVKGELDGAKEVIKVEVLEAVDAKIENLDVGDLTAINAEIENLKATKAEIEDLTALNAKIENLDVGDLSAVNAEIENLKANKAEITDLTATNANITTLNADLANIKTLVNGNLTSDNILSFLITADKVTMDDAFIKDAHIANVNANKINAGTINTANVSVVSEDGGLSIADETMQFKDENGVVRIQIGRDSSDNFTFVLYDETGRGQLINAYGIQSSDAIKDGLIRDGHISDNAAISGSKLDISSVITEINEDNSTTIKSNKIYLNEKGQSLEVAFNSLETKVDTIEGVTINGDLTSVIEQVQSNTTEINIAKEGINTLTAQNTTISQQIINLDGELEAVNTTLSSNYSTLEQNFNGFKTKVAETYATKDLLNNYSTTSTMNSAIEQNADSILSTVSSTYVTNDTLNNYSTTTEMNSAINQKADSILSTVSNTYVSDSDASKTYATKSELNQTANSWTATFESGYNKGIVEMNQWGIKVRHSDFSGWSHITSSGFYINNGTEDVIQLTTSGLQIKGAIKGGSTIDIGTSDDRTRSAFQVASNGVVGIGNTVTLNGVTYPAFRVGNTGNLKVGGASAYVHPSDGQRKGVAEITSKGTIWSCSETNPYTYARLTEGKLEISNTGYDPDYNGGSYVQDSYIKIESGQIAIYAASDNKYSSYNRNIYMNQEGIGSALGQVNFLNRIQVTGNIYTTSAIVINRNANAFRGVDTDGEMVSLAHVGADNVSRFGYGSWNSDSSLCYDAGTQFLGGSKATLRSKGVTFIGCNEDKYIRFAYDSTGNYVFRPNDQNRDIYCGTKNYQWYICYALNGCETGSDRTLKENIQYLDYNNINTKAIINNSITTQDCLDFITNDYLLATYNYISDNKKSTKLSAIAQDIIVNEDGSDNIIGQLVVNAKESTVEEAPLTMNQTQLLNVAIGAIQQLNAKVNELENRLKNS